MGGPGDCYEPENKRKCTEPEMERMTADLEHVYIRPEVNSDRFDISNRFEMLFRLHGNFTAATFQTTARLYCTCANDIF